MIFSREFQEDGGVFNVALEFFRFVDCCLQTAALFKDLLGVVLVIPEIGFTYLGF